MMNIKNVSEIMRLTDAVYESDKMSLGQDVESFKEIKDGLNPKRYILFENHHKLPQYSYALRDNLKSIGDGDAVIVTKVAEDGGKLVFSEKGFKQVIVVDMSQVTNIDEEGILLDIISNTMTKMRVAKLEKELKTKTAEISNAKDKAERMRTSIEQIKAASKEVKAGLGSINVNALKEVIEKATENTK